MHYTIIEMKKGRVSRVDYILAKKDFKSLNTLDS